MAAAAAEPLTEALGGMAGNGTAKAGSFLTFLVQDIQRSPAIYTTFAVLLALVVLVRKLSSPVLDVREPPIMQSRIPVIGHLLGMIQHGPHYFKTIEHRNMAIATLPILGGKMYGVWDPILGQSVHRNKALTFEPFAVEFAQRELGFDNEKLKLLQETNLIPEFFEGIHVAMTPSNVRRMNANALRYVAEVLAKTGDEPFETSNAFLWIRDLITMATADALYGHENPLKKDPSLLDELWAFDNDLARLMVNIVPSVTARRCYQARARLQAALRVYYTAKHDLNEDASQIVKNRAAVLRNYGLTGTDLGNFEIALLHVATANTIPTLFWFMAYVFTNRDLVARLRDEVKAVATHGEKDEVTLDISAIDEKCPLLVSCYREAIRVSNKGTGNRRVMEDTTIADGQGRSYLLKKGTNLQLSAEVFHSLDRAWGPDKYEFVADRFVQTTTTTKGNQEKLDAEKLKKVSWVPFGGGKNLCPGRNFAFAENLGFVASLVLGYEVTTLDENKEPTSRPPAAAPCAITSAASKPVREGEGFGMRVEKRKGWEKTKWLYTS
ncbi:hypothetical protein CMUS01_05738 [Colletotrichum musicola]|uniref:Prostacyclin synthase n=1 Tax=Colletotrichum musicola TaxID=2175873 RepID=A0A8H6KPY0_9PEZI|nr:hypothetical protein CMUS01_05738 [Colletotrichum musicola]